MREVSVSIVNRSRFTREALARTLGDGDGVSVHSHFESVELALPAILTDPVNLVILDYTEHLCEDAIRAIRTACPDVHVVVSGIPPSVQDVLPCARAGAAGYIRCDADEQDWHESIVGAVSGRVTDSVIAGILNSLLRNAGPEPQERASNGHFRISEMAKASGQRVGLTPRERQILSLVNDGLSTKAIARELALQPSTVKTHISAILTKYQVHRRSEAAAIFRRQERDQDPYAMH